MSKPEAAASRIHVVNAKVYLDDEELNLGTLVVDGELSRGANGVAFRATDPILERQVAVKFWLNLRRCDLRNKAQQGLAETRKTWIAQQDHVARIFFAGETAGLFFTVMELVPGITLKDWLTQANPSLGAKCHVAERLVDLDVDLQKRDVVHGDMHWKNVMIIEDTSPRPYSDLCKHRRWNLKVLDFGTSFYSGRSASRERHYRVLEKLVNRCIAPLTIAGIAASPPPTSLDAKDMQGWFHRGLFAIRAALFDMGHEFVGWPIYAGFGTYELTTKGFGLDPTGARLLLADSFNKGTLEASREQLGDTAEWGSFDGRTAKRND